MIASRAGIALAACLVLALFAGVAPAIGATDSSPVQLLDCRIHNRLNVVDPFRPVTIRFVNRGDAGIDEVRFTVEYAGRTATLVDRGTFSKDATVEHGFRAFWNAPYTGAVPEKCVIDSVRYANGTSS